MVLKTVKQTDPWKGPDEVRIISFSIDDKGDLTRIGGGDSGDIYAGRMRFKDGSVQRVAIKRFKEKLTDEGAQPYQDVIDDLKEALIDSSTGKTLLPKMSMVKLKKGARIGKEVLSDDEWVKVSQLFAKRDLETGNIESKIVNKSHANIETKEGRLQAVELLTNVANAGHSPIYDLLEPFKDPSEGVILFDIDLLVKSQSNFGKPSPEQRAGWLVNSIEEIGGTLDAVSEAQEYKELFDAAVDNSSPEMRKALEEIIPAF